MLIYITFYYLFVFSSFVSFFHLSYQKNLVLPSCSVISYWIYFFVFSLPSMFLILFVIIRLRFAELGEKLNILLAFGCLRFRFFLPSICFPNKLNVR